MRRKNPAASSSRNQGSTIPRAQLADLLHRASSGGDASAAADLAKIYGKRLYGLSWRILSDRQAAEDTVQDVFLALLQGKACYRGRGHPDAFLLKVTSFTAIDRAKKLAIGKTGEEALMAANGNRNTPSDPEAALLNEELKDEVARQLASLHPEARAAVTLRFWHGATIREVARILSRPRSTVNRLIEGALEKLRRPLLRRGLGMAAITSLLADVLEAMEPPPLTSAFHDRLVEAMQNGSGQPVDIPDIPDVSGFSLGSPAMVGVLLGVASIGVVIFLMVTGNPFGQSEAPRSVSSTGGTPDEVTTGPGAASTGANVKVGTTESRPGRTVSIAGRIIATTGQPLGGAAVRLLAGEDRLPFEAMMMLQNAPLAEIKADSRGRFAFEKLSPGSYRVLTLAPGSSSGTSGLLRLREGESQRGLEIMLSAASQVRGSVRLENGTPVAGIPIMAIIPAMIGDSVHGMWFERVISDRQGAFVIDGVGKRAVEIRAEPTAHHIVKASKYARPDGEPPEIVLVPGGTIRGRVSDAVGAGLGDVEVVAFAREREDRRRTWNPKQEVRRTRSTSTGAFVLAGLPFKELTLFGVLESGLQSEPVVVELAEERIALAEVDISMPGGQEITGTFSRDGEPFGPASGLAIPWRGSPGPPEYVLDRWSLYSGEPFSPKHLFFGTLVYEVAADGTFRTPPLPEGKYLLHAWTDVTELLLGWFMVERSDAGETPPRTIFEAGEHDIRVELPLALAHTRIAGHVIDTRGQPVANANVRCSFKYAAGNTSSIDFFTDQHGSFSGIFPVHAEGLESISLRAKTPTGQQAMLELEEELAKTDLEKLEIVIGSGEAIAGRVASIDGESISGASVTLEQDGHEPFPTAERQETETDASGRYSFSGMPTDRLYKVKVRATGWAAAEIVGIEVGESNVDFALQAEALVRGRVIDLEGRAVDPASMSMVIHEGSSKRSSPVSFEKLGDGGFVIHGLKPGDYSFAASGGARIRGRQAWTRFSERLVLAAGQSVDDLELVLLPLVSIRGVVRDARSGQSIAGAVVADWRLDDDTFPSDRQRVEADEQGEFVLEGFSHGLHMIYVAASGYLNHQRHVSVQGEGDTEIEFALVPAKDLIVEVRDDLGNPIEGVHVRVEWLRFHAVNTAADGRVIVPAPAGGMATLEAMKSKAWNSSTRNALELSGEGHESRRIELGEDDFTAGKVVVTLQRGGSLVGTVVDHEGQPVADITVMAHQPKLGGRGSTTNKEGRYRISSLLPGEWTVGVESEIKPMPSLKRPVVIFADRESRLDIALPHPSTYELNTIEVVAVFEDGSPAGHAKFQCSGGWKTIAGKWTHFRPVAASAIWNLETDADGTRDIYFEEPDLEGINCSGSFERDGELYRMKDSRVTIEGGVATLVYLRVPRGEIHLEVVEAGTGEPLSGYKYSFKTSSGGSGSVCRSVDGKLTKKTRTGEVTIKVEAVGYAYAEETVLLDDGGQRKVKIALRRE